MSNWVKKVVQKRNEQKQAEKKEGKNIMSLANFLCALIILSCAISFFVLSFKNYSSKMGCALAILSFWVTIFFEIYEWIILFTNYRKAAPTKCKGILNYLKDYPLLPVLPSIFFLFIFLLIIFFTNLINYNYSNMISSLTLCVYIISMLFRRIYSIHKED
mgnify:CR=1 FL=1